MLDNLPELKLQNKNNNNNNKNLSRQMSYVNHKFMYSCFKKSDFIIPFS